MELRDCKINAESASQEQLDIVKDFLRSKGEEIYKDTEAFKAGKSYIIVCNHKSLWAKSYTDSNISIENFIEEFCASSSFKFKPGDMVRFKSKNMRNAMYFSGSLEYLVIKTRCEGTFYDVYECGNKIKSWRVSEEELEIQPRCTIPKRGHTYTIPSQYFLRIEDISELCEAIFFGVTEAKNINTFPAYIQNDKRVHFTLPKDYKAMEWEVYKKQILPEYNFLYDYSLPILYKDAEEQQEAKDLGVKTTVTGRKIAIGINYDRTYHLGNLEELKSSPYVKDGYQEWGKIKYRIKEERNMPYNTATLSTAENDLMNTVIKVTNKYEFQDVIKYLNWEERNYSFKEGINAFLGYSDGTAIFIISTDPIVTNANVITFEVFYERLSRTNQSRISADVSKLEEAPRIWKNPRPTIPNTRGINVGDLVVIDGLKPCQKVDKVTAKSIYIGKKRYKKENAYPLFELSKNVHASVGNIYIQDGKPKIFVGRGGDIGYDTTCKLYSLTPEVIKYDSYTCGAIRCNDISYKSFDELKALYPYAKLKPHQHQVSYTNIEIASHYGIQESKLVPKDLTIAEEIVKALDHPLNVAAKEWVLLVGESGTGKTEAAIKYANSVSKKYVKLQGTAQVTVDDLQGYKSITTGVYFRSLLREAVEHGYIFILDEIDACNPNTLLVLNGLKQEYYQFPDELIKVHPEFRMVATANTLTYDEKYNARSPMDKATIARFKVIQYEMEDYDLAMRYGLKYICKVDNLNRLTAREVSREVINLKIQEEIDGKSNTVSTDF